MYANISSHSLPTCDTSQGLLTVALRETRDFVESVLTYINVCDTFGNWEFHRCCAIIYTKPIFCTTLKLLLSYDM
jgi:hypothetical protein